VDPPHRNLDPHLVERLLPREHVLVDAVHERAIQVEQERRRTFHAIGPS